LDQWLKEVDLAFADRMLPVDRAVTDAWGAMSARGPVPVIDGLLAATAKVHGLVLVTRNDTHVAELGTEVLNPFKADKP
jgi:hypothetical protein